MGSSALVASQQVQATSQARLAKSDSAAGATCSGLAREAERQQHGGRDRRAAGRPQASRSWHPTVCCGDGKCFQPRSGVSAPSCCTSASRRHQRPHGREQALPLVRRREQDPSALKNLPALAFAPHKNAH
ncbi:uncharacterized protein K441DRAFT_698930 [Cenococcum geophilum 1.58]|uniref:uncharacterized protein n=1 Tax=Cenococcum geophilum 1.58 TaxID=794803 RepID=UPI00358EE3FF|nr:hypothetical protein K441DRAFT_698930 [Cenococcum geophilum 1.58]